MEGCINVAARRGLCWAHRKRESRGMPVNVDLVERVKGDRLRILVMAAIRLADLKATDDEGWEKARDYLRVAAIRYARSLPSSDLAAK